MCDLFTKQISIRRSQGIFIPFFAVIVVALIAIVGLGIDAARIYRTKIELQQALDAAAVAGARTLVRYPGLSLAQDVVKVNRDSLDIVAENLTQAGVPLANITGMRDNLNSQYFLSCFGPTGDCCYVPGQAFTCNINANDERRFITVSARVQQPTLILGALPGFSNYTMVSASSRLENLKLQVVLVLDRSGSMNSTWGGTATKKIESLRSAVSSFISSLLPFDEIAIVGFSAVDEAAALRPTFTGNEPSNTPANLQLLRNAYENDSFSVFKNNTWTGTACPPFPAGSSMMQIGPLPSVVASAANNSLTQASGFFPYGNTDIGSGLWRGRITLDCAQTMPANVIRIIVLATDGAPNGSDGIDNSCTANCPSSSNYNPITWYNVGERPLSTPGNPCTNPLRPNQNSRTDRQKLRALDAIIESDLARDEGYLVFSIGLGNDDTNYSSPFQNVNDTDALKRVVLQRVANDQDAMTAPPALGEAPTWNYPGVTPIAPYIWDFPCVRTGLESQSLPVGKYYHTTNQAELQNAFLEIALIRSRFQP